MGVYVKEQYDGDLRGEGRNVLYFYVFHTGEGEMGGAYALHASNLVLF